MAYSGMGLFWAFPIFFFPSTTAHIAITRRIADETDPTPGVLDRQGCILLGPLRCRFELSTEHLEQWCFNIMILL